MTLSHHQWGLDRSTSSRAAAVTVANALVPELQSTPDAPTGAGTRQPHGDRSGVTDPPAVTAHLLTVCVSAVPSSLAVRVIGPALGVHRAIEPTASPPPATRAVRRCGRTCSAVDRGY